MAKKQKNPKVGRPRLYETGAQLEKKINQYFDSISSLQPVENLVPMTMEDENGEKVPLKDNYGHIQMHYVPVKNLQGQTAMELVWTEPPSIEALCVFLGISHTTWEHYCKDEEFVAATTRARGRVEAYLSTVGIRNPKTARAAEFSLTHNFGWKNESRVEVTGGSVEDYLKHLDEQGKGQEM